jgi:hypothetical protein
MEIPETTQAAALEEVARLGARRRDLLAQVEAATADLRDAAVTAARQGATRSRVRELADVSASTLYGWLDAAGIQIRTKGGK